MKKVLVAMSGGVDSAVTAAVLCRAGYECTGVTMKLYGGAEEEETISCSSRTCCTLADVEDARAAAFGLGMRFYVFNFTDDFAAQVIDRFVAGYEAGETPNPCIDCNRYMKFEKLYQRARALGLDAIATGHYARIEQDGATGRWLLKKARCAAKDQSYVLAFLTQEQLAHTLLPLGQFESKEQVRALAGQLGLSNAQKPDSQDICFVRGGDYAQFIRGYTGKDYPAGPFVDGEGRVLGLHKGMIGYTIGQRKGLGLALPQPMYVKGKRLADNAVVLGRAEELYSGRLVARDFNWIPFQAPQGPVRVQARTRYHGPEAPATARVLADGRVEVVFDIPQRAVTPGQAVVLYDGDLVVGGGTICAEG